MKKDLPANVLLLGGCLAALLAIPPLYRGTPNGVRWIIIAIITVVTVASLSVLWHYIIPSENNQDENTQQRPKSKKLTIFVSILGFGWLGIDMLVVFTVSCLPPARVEGPVYANFDPVAYKQVFGKIGDGTFHDPIQKFHDRFNETEFSKLKWFDETNDSSPPMDRPWNLPPEKNQYQGGHVFFRLYKTYYRYFVVLEDIEVEVLRHLNVRDEPLPPRGANCSPSGEPPALSDIREISFSVSLSDAKRWSNGGRVLKCNPYSYSIDDRPLQYWRPSSGIVLSDSPFVSVGITFDADYEDDGFYLINVYAIVSSGDSSPRRILVTKEPFWIGFETIPPTKELE